MRQKAVDVVSRIVAMLILVAAITPNLVSQEPSNTQQAATAKISWSTQPGVTRFRFQVATDEQFQDVLFDRLVEGNEYVVSDLAPGRYFWRIAPQTGPTAGHFLKAVSFEAKLPIPKQVEATPVTALDNKTRTRLAIPGWSVATGEIVRLMAAKLRSGTSTDFLGINSEGTIYALDGARGVALWTARFNLTSQVDQRIRSHYNQFPPLFFNAADDSLRVVVAFDSGLRAVAGPTGNEIWRTKIAGRPLTGTVIGSDIYLVAERADKLLVLDSATGQLKSQMTLRDEAVGPPVLLTTASKKQLLIPLKAGLIELRALDGDYLRSFKMATEVTTQPIVVTTSSGERLLFGLKNGLAAFDATTLEPLGRIAIDAEDYPVGTLNVADLDGDKLVEVLMTTRAGRVMAVDVADGKIRWSTDAGYAPMLSFADLDADNKLDLVLPGKTKFAVGISGLTGSVIWESGEGAPPATGRSLAVASITDGRLIIAGTDGAVAGLRAFEVPKTKGNP